MLRVVASALAVVCKGMKQLPTILGPTVHLVKVSTRNTLETLYNAHAWPQQCQKSSANASNIVALRFGDHGTKEILGVVGSKVRLVSNVEQQLPTANNNMQQGGGVCAKGRNTLHPTMLGVVDQQCCICLHGA